MTATEDRRIQPRARVDWRVKFAVPGEDLNNGFLSDVNATGVCILGTVEYPVGQVIEIHFGAFQENREHQFRLSATVRHATRGKIGLQFLDGPVVDERQLFYLLRGVFFNGEPT